MSDSASVWNYRCVCGKSFTNTFGRSGLAYCPKMRCQRTCSASSPVAPTATPADAVEGRSDDYDGPDQGMHDTEIEDHDD